MTVARIGEVSPLDSLTYSDDSTGGTSVQYQELWSSTVTDPDTAIADILTAIDSAGYGLGEGGYSPPFEKCVVISREVRQASPDDRHHWHVTIRLGPRVAPVVNVTDDWVYSYSSSLGSAETNVDSEGTFIVVGTLATADPTPTGGPYTAVPRTGAQVQKYFPSVKISVRGQLKTNPFGNFKDKVGTLNSASMTLGGVSMAIGTTMLVNADVSTNTDSIFFNVVYQFEYRQEPLDWYAVVVAIDPTTGKPFQNIKGTLYKVPEGDETKGDIGVVDGSIGYKIYKSTDLQSLITVV